MRQRPFTAELQTRRLHAREGALPVEPEGDDDWDVRGALQRLEDRLAALSDGMADRGAGSGPTGADARRAAETRRELASLTGQGEDETDRIEAAEQELAAIVEATETATQTILEATEDIDRVIGEVSSTAGSPVVAEQLAEAAEAVTRIFQASTFQDITGQRIAKVVRTLSFIDKRLAALSELWSEGDEPAGPAPADSAGQASEAEADGGAGEWDESKLLNGPQLENQGISQAEIDKLFD